MAKAEKRTGFFVVKFGGRWFDVAMAEGNVVLASAHDNGEIPWDAFTQGLGTWTNASPFPTPVEPVTAATATVRDTPQDAGKKRKPTGDDAMALRVQEATDLVSSILEGCDEIPERGEEFAESVREKAADIGNTIEERQFVTDSQLRALENMLAGVNRWIDH